VVGVLVAVEHGCAILDRQDHRFVGLGRILGNRLLFARAALVDNLRPRLGDRLCLGFGRRRFGLFRLTFIRRGGRFLALLLCRLATLFGPFGLLRGAVLLELLLLGHGRRLFLGRLFGIACLRLFAVGCLRLLLVR